MAEVTHLVEQPTALRGTFAERFLALPREVLITVMRDKQRYFAVEDEQGRLLPNFITVRNGDAEHLEIVQKGNAHVLVARFSDAEFFYQADIKQPLESYLERLSTLTFQEKLGSMLDKNNRVARLVRPFGEMLGAADDLIEVAERAARLAKADLGTHMVVELTSLQGTMGRIYALQGGVTPEVAVAISDHWLPRGAGDVLPASPAGVLLALLDRLDSLVGLFAAGLAPTGSADPFGLRRQALGLILILIDRVLPLNLRGAVQLIGRGQPLEVSLEQQESVLEFIGGRLRVWLQEQGQQHDVIEAVLAEQAQNPARAVAAVEQLTTWVQRPDWEPILDAFARCVRILPDGELYTLRPAAWVAPAEAALYEAYQRISDHLPQSYNIGEFLAAFESAVPTVNRFFEELMVNDPDPALRENRLALLQAVTGLARGRADFSKLNNF
ncbi:MAG: glycine--tRNA ligase subunit beta [Anaerolineae bacterium]|nr:glycine--tRNA ligase subunit beta [Anaerolineae bacterium]